MQTFGIILIVIAGIVILLSGIFWVSLSYVLKNKDLTKKLIDDLSEKYPMLSEEVQLNMLYKIKTVCGTILLIALVCLGGGIAMICIESNNNIKIK